MRPTTLATITLALPLLTRARPGRDEPRHRPEPNTHGLPTGRRLARLLRKFFRLQARRVLGTIPTIGVEPPATIPSVTDWTNPMARAMTPVIGGYWEAAGRRQRERIGLDPDEWRVTDPSLRRAIWEQSHDFCQATNQTTSLELQAALRRLRAELTAGMVEGGETLDQLRARVRTVFDRADQYRARRIAASEASRATHAAELRSAQESGVVAGFEWLVSADACPLCQAVAARVKRVRLGDRFAVVGDNPTYRDVRFPPLHPQCMCSVIEILKPEYGGPVDPGWGEPLIQPTDDDAPEREVEPDPDARKNAPRASRRPEPGLAFPPGEPVDWIEVRP